MDERSRAAVIGIVTFVALAGLLIGGAALTGGLTALVIPSDDTETREYDLDELYIAQQPADGEVDVEPAAQPGTVLFDRAHNNRYEPGDIRHLRSGMIEAGHEVRDVEPGMDLEAELVDADVLVVIDPGQPYSENEVDAVEQFLAEGGALILLGQPDRMDVEGFEFVTERSEFGPLTDRLNVNFGSDYVLDMQENDGNFRNPIVRGTDHPLMTDVDEAAVSIPTYVYVEGGEPLLVTHDTAQRSDSRVSGEYTIAAANDNILAIGDVDFLRHDRYNVLDTEALIEAIIEFADGA